MNGLTSEVAVEYEDGGYRCYTMPDGKTHHPLGCSHGDPHKAARHAEELTKRNKENEDG